MLRRVLSLVPDLPRLRLSSLDPAALDEELWALIASEPRLMPHLHLSLQSGADLILKRMKRRHDAAQAAGVIARARRLRPGIAIGADLIAGFPTETDALAAETLAFVRDQAIPYLHVFPYSERPGTPAARMPAVPHPVRRARAAALREASAEAAAQFHAAQLGASAQVVIERAGEGHASGHTEHFAPVRVSGCWQHASLIPARITGADASGLWAEAA
jgi:threonylcarbamoyladenosine tRNA methylthiotransferase MtaB